MTSPSRRTAPSLPAAVPEAAAEPGDDKQPVEDMHAQSPSDAGTEVGDPAPAASSASPAAEDDQSAPPAQPPAPPQASAAVAPPAGPPAASAPQQIITDDVDDNDDDLGDIEAAPNDEGDDEVDEDWGYEST